MIPVYTKFVIISDNAIPQHPIARITIKTLRWDIRHHKQDDPQIETNQSIAKQTKIAHLNNVDYDGWYSKQNGKSIRQVR